jgi:Family of unknown function (DUF6682)
MKLGEMIQSFRLQVDDVAQPYLWSDPELMDYANEAEEEACRRARLIEDASTVAVTQLSLTNGVSTYALDDSIIFTRRVKITTMDCPLGKIRLADLDMGRGDWESDTGEPEFYCLDYENDKILFYPTPDASYTANLRVVRLPLNEMNDNEDTPEINRRFHRGLINWMKFKAYSKEDSEARDDQEAGRALALFTEEFGIKSTAIDEEWQERTYTDEADGRF